MHVLDQLSFIMQIGGKIQNKDRCVGTITNIKKVHDLWDFHGLQEKKIECQIPDKANCTKVFRDIITGR